MLFRLVKILLFYTTSNDISGATIMEETKCYTIHVKVNDKYLDNPDDKVIIYMKLNLKDNKVDGFNFGCNHEIVNQELHTALDSFQLWLKQKLPNPEIIAKLQELDRLQYGNDIVCNNIGQAIAKLYHKYILDNELKN